MKDVRKLKQFQSMLSNMIADLETLNIEIANKQREQHQKREAINKLKLEISKINNNNDLKVSEHTIVRYFERVKGFNIEEIQNEILSDNVVKLVEQLGGNGSYPNEGFSVVIKNNTVTTVV